MSDEAFGPRRFAWRLRTLLIATAAICLYLAAQRALSETTLFRLKTLETTIFAGALFLWLWRSRIRDTRDSSAQHG
jgi:hypothetical protein